MRVDARITCVVPGYQGRGDCFKGEDDSDALCAGLH
jgi:hypothetical protein